MDESACYYVRTDGAIYMHCKTLPKWRVQAIQNVKATDIEPKCLALGRVVYVAMGKLVPPLTDGRRRFPIGPLLVDWRRWRAIANNKAKVDLNLDWMGYISYTNPDPLHLLVISKNKKTALCRALRFQRVENVWS